MKTLAFFGALGAAAIAIPVIRSRTSPPSAGVPSALFATDFSVPDVPTWTPPRRALPFLFAVEQTESRYGIPNRLLARLIDQESAWDPKAHNKKSDASGIAQIVPKWHPNVNYFEPFAAIDYAGKFLRENFDRFGTWERALAAYNWGPGNVRNWIQSGEVFAALPGETQNYVNNITGDVPV